MPGKHRATQVSFINKAIQGTRDALEGGHQEVNSKHLNLSHALEKPIRSYPSLLYFYFTFFFFEKI